MAKKELTFAERMQLVKNKIDTEEMRTKFEIAKAPGVDVALYTQSLFTACGANLKVLNSEIQSLSSALMDSIALGLRIGGPLAYGYVVPYKGKAQFQAGYKGLLKLAYNDARATTAAAEVVRGNDKFNYELGSSPYIRHERDSKPTDAILYAWASISVVSGPPFIAVWSREYLEQHATKYIRTDDNGKYHRDSLIVTNYEEWCRKTMLRRALKYMPMSETARRVLDSEEYIAEGIDPEPSFANGDKQETATLRDLINNAPGLDA